MAYISVFDLVVLAMLSALVIYEMIQGKSNCLFWATPRWLRRGIAGEESYLCFRTTRVPFGIFHCLLGERDPTRYRINMTSYKPIGDQVKHRLEPVFLGEVVEGDKP